MSKEAVKTSVKGESVWCSICLCANVALGQPGARGRRRLTDNAKTIIAKQDPDFVDIFREREGHLFYMCALCTNLINRLVSVDKKLNFLCIEKVKKMEAILNDSEEDRGRLDAALKAVKSSGLMLSVKRERTITPTTPPSSAVVEKSRVNNSVSILGIDIQDYT